MKLPQTYGAYLAFGECWGKKKPQLFKPWLLSIHHVGSNQPMGELSDVYPWEEILSLVPQWEWDLIPFWLLQPHNHYTKKKLFIATYNEEMHKQINLVANLRVLVATFTNP